METTGLRGQRESSLLLKNPFIVIYLILVVVLMKKLQLILYRIHTFSVNTSSDQNTAVMESSGSVITKYNNNQISHNTKQHNTNKPCVFFFFFFTFGIKVLQDVDDFFRPTPGISIHNVRDTVLLNNTLFSDNSQRVNNLIWSQGLAYTLCSH